ncbi:hypothetical protein BDV3_006753 [Batrachochytrium dendrobatidis]
MADHRVPDIVLRNNAENASSRKPRSNSNFTAIENQISSELSDSSDNKLQHSINPTVALHATSTHTESTHPANDMKRNNALSNAFVTDEIYDSTKTFISDQFMSSNGSLAATSSAALLVGVNSGDKIPSINIHTAKYQISTLDSKPSLSSRINASTPEPYSSSIQQPQILDLRTSSQSTPLTYALGSDLLSATPSYAHPIANEPGLTIKGLYEYIKSELTSSDFDESQDFKTERIRNFLNVPRELEKFMYLGYLICLDSFLYIFTILPMRVLIASWWLICWCFGGKKMKPAQKTDLIKGALVFICTYILHYFDASRLYHSVRGQALIKLYVIFNVLEICDKLCSAFGHDILDSLFSLSHSRKKSAAATRRISRFTHFIVAVLYIFAHSLVLFYQVMTLNVAVNSFNNALMTLLLSNQFVEIKGSVFKRFERENLFQLSCSDIVERFQLSVFLIIIGIRNFIELVGGETIASFPTYIYEVYKSMPSILWISEKVMLLFPKKIPTDPTQVWTDFQVLVASTNHIITRVLSLQEYKLVETILGPIVIVYLTEILVDWLKHAFITKFNGISPTVYERYRNSLCRDLLGGGKKIAHVLEDETMKMSSVDRSPIVARRIGFVSIPLACLVIRVAIQTMQMISIHSKAQDTFMPEPMTNNSNDDGIVGWQIPFTIPPWLNSEGFSLLLSRFSIFDSLLWAIPLYFALVIFKLCLGLHLLRLAKLRLDSASVDMAAGRSSFSTTPIANADMLSKFPTLGSRLRNESIISKGTPVAMTSTDIPIVADPISGTLRKASASIIPTASQPIRKSVDSTATRRLVESVHQLEDTPTAYNHAFSKELAPSTLKDTEQASNDNQQNESALTSLGSSSLSLESLESLQNDTEITSNLITPLSPGINEDKLDKIDRFTMVKSRIV